MRRCVVRAPAAWKPYFSLAANLWFIQHKTQTYGHELIHSARFNGVGVCCVNDFTHSIWMEHGIEPMSVITKLNRSNYACILTISFTPTTQCHQIWSPTLPQRSLIVPSEMSEAFKSFVNFGVVDSKWHVVPPPCLRVCAPIRMPHCVLCAQCKLPLS